MAFSYKGYTLVQSGFNNHYMIFDKDGHARMHVQCTKRLTDQEKIEHIEEFMKLTNSDFFEKM